jgi:hypothetical protein
MNIKDLEAIMEAEPVLNTIGFGLGNCTTYKNLEERRAALADHRDALRKQIDTCAKVAAWLEENARPRKTINRNDSSYGWKHIVEKEIGKYVSNGAFIAAAIHSGFKFTAEGGYCPNAYFNIRTYKPGDVAARI